jgi:hypothetical protein
MPSFKERFRPSRKYKTTKEAGTTSIDESTIISGTLTNIWSTSTTDASTTMDDNTGSAALSTYHSHYSVDYCKSSIDSIRDSFASFLNTNRYRIL